MIEQSSPVGGICPYLTGDVMSFCREVNHLNFFRTASQDLLGTALGDTKSESGRLSEAWSLEFPQLLLTMMNLSFCSTRCSRALLQHQLQLWGSWGETVPCLIKTCSKPPQSRKTKVAGAEWIKGEGKSSDRGKAEPCVNLQAKPVLPVQQRALEERKALLGRRGGKEPLHKYETYSVLQILG